MPSPTSWPTLSVVVPAFNAPENLERCLEGLARSGAAFELVVADDCSTDRRVAELARSRGARYHRLAENSGPAAARNAGAKLASGDLIVFIDSDCVVHGDTLERIQTAFRSEPGLAAVFGSYDDDPAHPGVVSVYRNLLHHFTHHTGPREASTFWAGCGAVRRELFLGAGGFDERTYRRPQIEDIELGMRLRSMGERIQLLPEIQVKHLKRWRFWEMVRIDVTCRAIPWTKLLLDRPGTGGDLNLETSQKACVVLVFAAIASALALSATALVWGSPAVLAVAVPAVLLAPVVWINRQLYRLFLRRRGFWFAIAGVGLHFLYFIYGGLAFLFVRLTYRRSGESTPVRPARAR